MVSKLRIIRKQTVANQVGRAAQGLAVRVVSSHDMPLNLSLSLSSGDTSSTTQHGGIDTADDDARNACGETNRLLGGGIIGSSSEYGNKGEDDWWSCELLACGGNASAANTLTGAFPYNP